MSDEILVAYGTWAGSTGEVAEAIGKTLREGGLAVDVAAAEDVAEVGSYGAVIVGTGIRAGRLHPEVLKFLKAHEAALSGVPVAYFVVCLSMMEDTEEQRAEVLGYLEAAREAAPQVEPVDIGLFGGVMDFDKLVLPIRLMMKAMKSPEGDYRDWDAIQAWMAQVRPALLGT
jgi:menaquinone-dependent protoporphyrinogen oxidase